MKAGLFDCAEVVPSTVWVATASYASYASGVEGVWVQSPEPSAVTSTVVAEPPAGVRVRCTVAPGSAVPLMVGVVSLVDVPSVGPSIWGAGSTHSTPPAGAVAEADSGSRSRSASPRPLSRFTSRVSIETEPLAEVPSAATVFDTSFMVIVTLPTSGTLTVTESPGVMVSFTPGPVTVMSGAS